MKAKVPLTVETNVTILEDLATAFRNVLPDMIPLYKAEVKVVSAERLEVVYRDLKDTETTRTLLLTIGQSFKAFVDKALPKLKIQIMVVGGSNACGLEVKIINEGQKYPYFHVVHKNDIALVRKGIV